MSICFKGTISATFYVLLLISSILWADFSYKSEIPSFFSSLSLWTKGICWKDCAQTDGEINTVFCTKANLKERSWQFQMRVFRKLWKRIVSNWLFQNLFWNSCWQQFQENVMAILKIILKTSNSKVPRHLWSTCWELL